MYGQLELEVISNLSTKEKGPNDFHNILKDLGVVDF
jgi:hypothetical protein